MRHHNQSTIGARIPHSAFRIPCSPAERRSSAGFTLVELLVVIAIIAILAGLLIVAAAGAIRTASQTRIVAEMEQFNTALEDYKNNFGSYPPNTVTDSIAETSTRHLDNDRVLADFKRHLKKVAPNHREPSELIDALVGAGSGPDPNLPGGMNAAEAIVFWLGGFSDDPEYPISGVGGPSYAIAGSNPPANQQDPIESRSWRLDIDVANLGPRDASNYFDESDSRFIVYDDPRNPGSQRRINFWYLKAPGSPLPYVYFDASRGSSATGANDPPAVVIDATNPVSDQALTALYYVHAIKRPKNDASANEPLLFANDGKFQILHGGIDERWGEFPIVNPNDATQLIDSEDRIGGTATVNALIYPDGPWTLDLADTITNFAGGTLEDAQP